MTAKHHTHRRRPRRPAEQLPPWLRPKLTPSQQFELTLAHHVNLDALADGTATPKILWQWVGGALTWHYIAMALCERNPTAHRPALEGLQGQFGVTQCVVQRYRTSGLIQLEAGELDVVREACQWAEALAEHVDRPTALRCSVMSEQVCQRIADQVALTAGAPS